jgi:predicted dehydrogenase
LLRLAVVGIGRIGRMHALHTQDVALATGGEAQLTALVDIDISRARRMAEILAPRQKTAITAFASVEDMMAAGVADASVVCTPTDVHRLHATQLAEAGQRILLEKPLTGELAGDREFAHWLDQRHPHAVMLAFQRRYDAALRYARQVMDAGTIGRVFKVVSCLEDSSPAPDGYNSSGILPDMSVHNVDEILWLTGRMPEAAAVVGNCLYSRKLSTAVEDFDDGLLYLWYPGEMAAQVMVSRNHVSGYRVETWIYGELGQIHVGRFEQNHHEVVVEAYGRRNRTEPLAFQRFPQREYGEPMPEFADRFGNAYYAEVAEFVEKCVAGKEFAVTHRDGVRAMEVIDAGMRSVIDRSAGGKVAP